MRKAERSVSKQGHLQPRFHPWPGNQAHICKMAYSLCLCIEKNKMAALSFSCLSHRIGLFLKWAISTRVWLLFKELTTVYKIFSCRIILNRFYLSGHHFISMMQCWMKACWALPKLCTTRSVSSHKGTCYWDMYPQHSHVCANVVILSLLHVPTTRPCYMSPQCALHTFLSTQHITAACLQYDPSCLATFTTLCFSQLVLCLFTNSATVFPPTEMFVSHPLKC